MLGLDETFKSLREEDYYGTQRRFKLIYKNPMDALSLT